MKFLFVFNVIVGAALLIWFLNAPQPPAFDVQHMAHQTITQDREFDAAIKSCVLYDFAERSNAQWKHRAMHMTAWANSAGTIILLNAAFCILYLTRSRSEHSRDNTPPPPIQPAV